MERKLRFFEAQIEKANSDKDLPPYHHINVAPAPLDGGDRMLSMDELEVRMQLQYF
jgi:hypothetical protein